MAPADPTQGAARREGFLLAAFALLALVGLWTVVVSELTDDTGSSLAGQSVAAPTEKSKPDIQ